MSAISLPPACLPSALSDGLKDRLMMLGGAVLTTIPPSRGNWNGSSVCFPSAPSDGLKDRLMMLLQLRSGLTTTRPSMTLKRQLYVYQVHRLMG